MASHFKNHSLSKIHGSAYMKACMDFKALVQHNMTIFHFLRKFFTYPHKIRISFKHINKNFQIIYGTDGQVIYIYINNIEDDSPSIMLISVKTLNCFIY